MRTNTENAENRSSTSRLVDSVDHMVRLPFEMTGATWDLIVEGMQSMTGRRSSGTRSDNRTSSDDRPSGSSWTWASTGHRDQDLSGDDLKYVIWSIVFTKPDFECVLEPRHDDLVNYSAEGASFAALKIAKFLERARHGHIAKPESWGERYPPSAGRRGETTNVAPARNSTADAAAGTTAASSERGWRIPVEDQKYITFLYRVDRRLPKQEAEVERVTIERGVITKVA